MDLLRFTVPEESERADRFLGRCLPGTSRRERMALFAGGQVRLDGHPVRKGDTLPPGCTILVDIPTAGALAAEPGLPVPLLYEDDDLVAVDKPPGMPGHALRTSDRGTVANFLAGRFPEALEASDRVLDAGLVHRLDTATSGVLLAARNAPAWQKVRTQFRERRVGKCYVARVAGKVTAAREISLPLRTAGGRLVRVGGGGREASTSLRPVRTEGATTLLEIDITTGVRHQIRAHLAAVGHPVVGDVLYGGPPAARLHLHAVALSFDHPAGGIRTTIRSTPSFD